MTPSLKFLGFAVVASTPVALTPLGVPLTLAILPTLVVLAIALADRLFGTSTPIEIERRVKPVLSVGIGNQVEIAVRNLSARSLRLQVADETPEAGTADPARALMDVHAGPYKTALVSYSFTPARRGRHFFTGVQARHQSRLGFWAVRRRFELDNEVHVYPNIDALHRFDLLARVNNLQELGVRTIRMRGEGTEFERLREYRQGDEPRNVDWKATARLNKLIVREMGRERNQNILIMIDTGRMMRQTTDGLSHFDYALNTAIILGHVAAGRGDNVGAIFFSDQVKRFVPLGRGRSTVDAIVRAGYDLEPESTATSYARVFRYLSTHVRKRSLLLLITHLVPGEDRRLIGSYLKMMGRQHLPLCLFFREPALEAEALKVPSTVREVFHGAGAADILLERNEGLLSLSHAGVMATDALPGELSTVAIGRYLDIKARNLL